MPAVTHPSHPHVQLHLAKVRRAHLFPSEPHTLASGSQALWWAAVVPLRCWWACQSCWCGASGADCGRPGVRRMRWGAWHAPPARGGCLLYAAAPRIPVAGQAMSHVPRQQHAPASGGTAFAASLTACLRCKLPPLGCLPLSRSLRSSLAAQTRPSLEAGRSLPPRLAARKSGWTAKAASCLPLAGGVRRPAAVATPPRNPPPSRACRQGRVVAHSGLLHSDVYV